MSLTLSPVIELGYYNQGNDMPQIESRHSFSEEWLKYRTECLRLGGMPDPIPPRYRGTDFYAIDDFAGENLHWLIQQHVAEYIDDDPNQICPFFGGYILSSDSEALLYPQCCGDLGDIIWWKHVCYSSKCLHYNGHPCPELSFTSKSIVFLCNDPYDPFDSLSKERFEVDRQELKEAFERVIPSILKFKSSIESCLRTARLPIAPDQLANMLTISNCELNDSNVYAANK